MFAGLKITAQSKIIRGPYLQKASPTSMTIKWRTAEACISDLYYGTEDTKWTQIVSSELVTNHEVQLVRLEPNTKYYYKIDGPKGSQNTDRQYFKTVPLQSTKLRAWVLGDCGMGDQNTRNVRDAFLKKHPEDMDMIIMLGDNAYNSGTDDEYQRAIFENMYEEQMKKTVTWSCLGNHDGYSTNATTQGGPYYDIFSFPTKGECGGMASGTESYYSYDYGDTHFIVLNSYQEGRSTEDPMFKWCQADIQSTSATWIVALWHHPPYSKGSHNSDFERRMIQMRKNYLPMLEAYGVDLVLSGHSHSYERTYFLNGHYGMSGSFDIEKHTLGKNGKYSGKEDSSGAYIKKYYKLKKECPGMGSVYITAGSSSKISGGALNHPAMFVSLNRLGSLLLEVDESELKCTFIQDDGSIGDYFSIIDKKRKKKN